MGNKHTQYVDFNNPNADKITIGVTNKPMINKKQTAVEWLVEQISSSKYFYNLMEEIESRGTIAQPNGILHQAKEMEKEQKIELLKWRETRFTKDAPLEYVLIEFEKLQNK